MRTPARGDVWLVSLNPTLGKEQQGLRPVLVVSDKAFNNLGLCVVCPITQGGLQSRFAGFAVTLMGSASVSQGVVMCNQPRTIDMHARSGRFVEALMSRFLMDEVLARLQPIFEL
ncbi:type II toxin-antitoxin system PemK/MazF family toxin [Rhodoferax sp.]|uniref:type II toxin-antitoxin system PemK/MazF family toxin n=1 Tax=Rhodoferax sp. TaxID=50421 RepID=UPI002627FAB6|nr:type II toxin-antitoxin system PemK/MazF family toxin [Rhodoferax sp.]MDD5479695.1 type II toxin-antitoxin system PemK/MazF family toxin [Rhodoferax sp.]